MTLMLVTSLPVPEVVGTWWGWSMSSSWHRPMLPGSGAVAAPGSAPPRTPRPGPAGCLHTWKPPPVVTISWLRTDLYPYLCRIHAAPPTNTHNTINPISLKCLWVSWVGNKWTILVHLSHFDEVKYDTFWRVLSDLETEKIRIPAPCDQFYPDLIINSHPEPRSLGALQQGLSQAQLGDPGIRHNQHWPAAQLSENVKTDS